MRIAFALFLALAAGGCAHDYKSRAIATAMEPPEVAAAIVETMEGEGWRLRSESERVVVMERPGQKWTHRSLSGQDIGIPDRVLRSRIRPEPYGAEVTLSYFRHDPWITEEIIHDEPLFDEVAAKLGTALGGGVRTIEPQE